MRVSCRWGGHHLRISIMPPGYKYQGLVIIVVVLSFILAGSYLAPTHSSLRLWSGIPLLITLGLLSTWPGNLIFDRYSGVVEYWPGIWRNQKIRGILKDRGEVHLISIDGRFDGDNTRKRRFHILISSTGGNIKLPPIFCFEQEAWNYADGVARAFGIPMRQATVAQIRTE